MIRFTVSSSPRPNLLHLLSVCTDHCLIEVRVRGRSGVGLRLGVRVGDTV